MLTFPKYGRYKDSGVEWLGEIPSHWKVLPFKRIFSLIYRYPTYYGIQYLETGVPEVRGEALSSDGKIIELEDQRYISYRTNQKYPLTVLEVGDIVMSVRGTMGKIGLVDNRFKGANITGNLIRLKPQKGLIESNFLVLSLLSQYFLKQLDIASPQTTIKTITVPKLSEIPIFIPTFEEQNRIVEFLDRTTTDIDRAIAQKQRLIELLQEQKAILINQAVTKGLNPNVPMRDSGIDAIGEIPEYWVVRRLKHFTSNQSGITLGKTYTSNRLIRYPYLRVANVQYGYFKLDDIAELALPEEEAIRYFVKSGDILVTEGGDIDKLGRGTVWEGQIENCLHQNHIFAIRVNRNVVSEYFVSLAMSCDYARKYFIDTAVKTTNLASTNRTKLGNLPVLIPPLNEQLKIIEHCRMIEDEHNKVIGVVWNELKQIGELRQILIAEAVTGKIKV